MLNKDIAIKIESLWKPLKPFTSTETEKIFRVSVPLAGFTCCRCEDKLWGVWKGHSRLMTAHGISLKIPPLSQKMCQKRDRKSAFGQKLPFFQSEKSKSLASLAIVTGSSYSGLPWSSRCWSGPCHPVAGFGQRNGAESSDAQACYVKPWVFLLVDKRVFLEILQPGRDIILQIFGYFWRLWYFLQQSKGWHVAWSPLELLGPVPWQAKPPCPEELKHLRHLTLGGKLWSIENCFFFQPYKLTIVNMDSFKIHHSVISLGVAITTILSEWLKITSRDRILQISSIFLGCTRLSFLTDPVK